MADAGSIIAIYDDYYADGKVAAKREIASQQSVGHIEAILPGETFEKVLDIGAGEGAVLDNLNKRNLAKTLGADEISTSGIEAIKARKIPSRKSSMFLMASTFRTPTSRSTWIGHLRRRARTDVFDGGGEGLQEALHRGAAGAYAKSHQGDPHVRILWAYQFLHAANIRKFAQNFRPQGRQADDVCSRSRL
ncbi:hypothetical protein ACWTU8_04555 [Mesorhizobium sp. BHbdii]